MHVRHTHHHMSPTGTFVLLGALALLITFTLYRFNKLNLIEDSTSNVIVRNTGTEPKVPPIDLSKWATYTSDDGQLSFRYPEDWKITKATQDKATVLQLGPDKSSPISVYTSTQGYFATDGLPLKKTEINGREAIMVDDTLVGMKQGVNYFTFDAGLNQNNKEIFKQLLKTIELK